MRRLVLELRSQERLQGTEGGQDIESLLRSVLALGIKHRCVKHGTGKAQYYPQGSQKVAICHLSSWKDFSPICLLLLGGTDNGYEALSLQSSGSQSS